MCPVNMCSLKFEVRPVDRLGLGLGQAALKLMFILPVIKWLRIHSPMSERMTRWLNDPEKTLNQSKQLSCNS